MIPHIQFLTKYINQIKITNLCWKSMVLYYCYTLWFLRGEFHTLKYCLILFCSVCLPSNIHNNTRFHIIQMKNTLYLDSLFFSNNGARSSLLLARVLETAIEETVCLTVDAKKKICTFTIQHKIYQQYKL